jgi:hypothetical protein
VTARDSIRFLLAIFVAGFLLASPWPALAQAPEPAGQMQALRDSLAFSKEQIKAYEWIETIVVQRDGEQKARIQNRVVANLGIENYESADSFSGPVRALDIGN